MRRSLLLLLPLVLLLAACGSSGTPHDGRLRVVAATTQLADFARQVGGDRVHVTQILRPNTDPHDYEPRANDVRATAEAQLILISGDNLDHWMKDVIKQSGSHATTLDLGAIAPVRLSGDSGGGEASRYDPHWWHDIRNARAAVTAIRDAMTKAAPAAAAAIDAAATSYDAKLEALDTRIAACMAAIPSSERKLVSDHDAFDYFAARYEITVVGTVIPSQTTQAQASAGDVADLVATIRREHVKAVFPEHSVNAKLARTIARESGASADHTLYGDTLGPDDSSGATYLAMEQANADAIVGGLTGGARGCGA